MKRTFATLAALSIASALTGCREQEFFYHAPPFKPAEHLDFSARIVDRSGFSSVDILWVIDNSGSMADHQAAVASNTALFMSRFRPGIAWKMGLISTSISEAPYVGFTQATELNDRTPGPDMVFSDAIRRLGVGGDSTERMFQPVLDKLNQFPNFMTPSGALAIIMVGDAMEQSDQGVRDQLLNYLRRVRGNLDGVFSYGVFAATDLSCSAGSGETPWTYAGSSYKLFIDQTQGSVLSLCSQTFGNDLAALADDLFARVMSPQIYLPRRPIVETLRVFYKGTELIGGTRANGARWYYDYALNSIVFYDLTFATGPLEEVQIQYEEDIGTIIPSP
jgi:hypothetical protein